MSNLNMDYSLSLSNSNTTINKNSSNLSENLTKIIEYIKLECEKKDIKFKENEKNLILECPICKYRDGKPNKLKFYISKDISSPLIFNCFRCGTKGSVFKLFKILKKYYQINLANVIDTQDLFYFNTSNLNTTLSKHNYLTYPKTYSEYLVNLKIEDIINFEFDIRKPHIQDYIFEELDLYENSDKLLVFSNIESLLKYGYTPLEYLREKRNLKTLIDNYVLRNLLFRYKDSEIEELDYFWSYKVLFHSPSVFSSNLKLRKFLNRITFLTFFNTKYFSRLIETNLNIFGRGSFNTSKPLRYLYPSLNKIFSKVQNNLKFTLSEYKPLINFDMVIYTLNFEILKLLSQVNNFLISVSDIDNKDNKLNLIESLENNFSNNTKVNNYSKKVLEIDNLYIFEGIFDGLKYLDLSLNLSLNLSQNVNKEILETLKTKFKNHSVIKELFLDTDTNTNKNRKENNKNVFIAVGGLNNFKFVYGFLKLLSLYGILTNSFYKLKINNLVFIFDGDLNVDKQILPIVNFIDRVHHYYNNLRKEKIDVLKENIIGSLNNSLDSLVLNSLEISNIKYLQFDIIRNGFGNKVVKDLGDFEI